MKLRRFFAAVALMTTGLASAQQQMQMPEIPIDDSVRIGKLDNGLTYYLRHNRKEGELLHCPARGFHPGG